MQEEHETWSRAGRHRLCVWSTAKPSSLLSRTHIGTCEWEASRVLFSPPVRAGFVIRPEYSPPLHCGLNAFSLTGRGRTSRLRQQRAAEGHWRRKPLRPLQGTCCSFRVPGERAAPRGAAGQGGCWVAPHQRSQRRLRAPPWGTSSSFPASVTTLPFLAPARKMVWVLQGAWP